MLVNALVFFESESTGLFLITGFESFLRYPIFLPLPLSLSHNPPLCTHVHTHTHSAYPYPIFPYCIAPSYSFRGSHTDRWPSSHIPATFIFIFTRALGLVLALMLAAAIVFLLLLCRCVRVRVGVGVGVRALMSGFYRAHIIPLRIRHLRDYGKVTVYSGGVLSSFSV